LVLAHHQAFGERCPVAGSIAGLIRVKHAVTYNWRAGVIFFRQASFSAILD
jgi:hypothetical protein